MAAPALLATFKTLRTLLVVYFFFFFFFFFWYSAVHNSRSMTPITWQAAVDDKEQRPLLQDILEAAIDDRRQVTSKNSGHSCKTSSKQPLMGIIDGNR